MVNANPYQQYQQNAIQSASGGDLTLLLYNGAMKFIKLGINLQRKRIFKERIMRSFGLRQ
jgi:flagellar protein FliS